MKIHELKTDPEVFYALAQGRKTYEIRRDDRGFHVGDTLRLRKTVHSGADMEQGEPLRYSGEEVTREITHILEGPVYGLAHGWVILSVNDPEKDALAAHVEAGREAVEHARQWVPQHVWSRLWLWKEESLTTSLARLKAEWQVEALNRLPATCDGKEQDAFEAHILSRGLPLTGHPLHYLFMDERTHAVRQAWRAAIEYCRRQAEEAP